MKKRVASLVLVSAMGVGAVSSVALTPLLAPALAAETTAAASQRLTDIKNALKGLVGDGTLTQAQANKVATTLDQALPQRGPGGRGGPGRGIEDAATVLGMTPEALRSALGTDTSLADVAQAKGTSKATLISKLVAAAKTRIAADVRAGRITQAHADEHLAVLETRITEMVDRVGPPMHRGGPEAPGANVAPPAASSSSAT